ncbi:MAG TPA: AAA family ATPase [Daejeonella sp.]|uniref:AAA family ATPase n=1 Tax=Daejeonella sp. TaxID=2805397 RepID=UPI002ED7CDCE
MKPDWADYKVYELFDAFISTCILTNDSFLTDEKDVITLKAIDDCIDRFIVKVIEGKDSFENKIRRQFDGAPYETVLSFAHVNWLWCMSPGDFQKSYKKNVASWILGDAKRVPIKEDIYPDGGFGDAGPSIKFRKHKEISFLLLVMKQLKLKVADQSINTLDDAKKMIENMCLESRFNWDSEHSGIVDDTVWKHTPEGKLAMYNILLHLSNPDKYEPVASDSHKDRIRNAFNIFIEEAPADIKAKNREEQILYIRGIVAEILKDDEFTFYDNYVGNIWGWGGKANSYEYDFDPLTALLYKRAIVLYGPPGTSKTYSAKQIAENAILRHHLPKCNLQDYLKTVSNKEEIERIVSHRIHRLQLHTNYNYEDFIGGIKLVDGKTIPQKGDLLKLIEDKVAVDDYPHILILDEINRVDLSRLFGEFFSAIENRNEEIKLSVGEFILKVPENLYVVGTMNEIDFSLERIDFALRRRFVWFPFGFSADSLREIIHFKQRDLLNKISADDLERFIGNSTNLNNKITEAEELGTQYHIGHTFFAEIVEIFKRFEDVQGRKLSSIFEFNGPVKILWDISIKPMLEAFLGNMEKDDRKEKIKSMEAVYING